MEKKLTIDEVIVWIMANSKDTEAMDKINKLTYPFTTHYLDKSKKDKDNYRKFYD